MSSAEDSCPPRNSAADTAAAMIGLGAFIVKEVCMRDPVFLEGGLGRKAETAAKKITRSCIRMMKSSGRRVRSNRMSGWSGSQLVEPAAIFFSSLVSSCSLTKQQLQEQQDHMSYSDFDYSFYSTAL